MKHLICFIIFVLLQGSLLAQNQWHQVTSPVSENFTSLCFIDSARGWMVTDTGTIISTRDGGKSWQVNSLSAYHFESVHFTDTNFGVIVGWHQNILDSSLILTTHNGGKTWNEKDHPKAERLYDVFFINDSIGWAVGINDPVGWILYSDDGGNTWVKQMNVIGVSGTLYSVHFRNDTVGHICGQYGTFLHTISGGTKGNGWAIEISNPSQGKDLYSLYNYSLSGATSVGADGTALYTLNNFVSFIPQNSNTSETLNAVHGPPANPSLWAVGNSGTIIYSQNYLLGWNLQNSGVTENLNDVYMTNSTDGWAVGDNGTILHRTTEDTTSGVGESAYYSCFKIYPNPASDILHVSFEEKEVATLRVYNTHGKLIQEDILPVEKGSTQLDVNSWPAGIYLVEVQNDGAVIGTTKLVVE